MTLALTNTAITSAVVYNVYNGSSHL